MKLKGKPPIFTNNETEIVNKKIIDLFYRHSDRLDDTLKEFFFDEILLMIEWLKKNPDIEKILAKGPSISKHRNDTLQTAAILELLMNLFLQADFNYVNMPKRILLLLENDDLDIRITQKLTNNALDNLN